MEIALVHTTGSPGSRHDSDSESSFERKRQSKSTSEMALHRKQSRRVSEVYSVFVFHPRHSKCVPPSVATFVTDAMIISSLLFKVIVLSLLVARMSSRCFVIVMS